MCGVLVLQIMLTIMAGVGERHNTAGHLVQAGHQAGHHLHGGTQAVGAQAVAIVRWPRRLGMLRRSKENPITKGKSFILKKIN